MLKFEYLAAGIRLWGAWYPILQMQWANGLALNEYVCRNLTSPERIIALAAHFGDVIAELRRSEIAHGDLQHGNVLVDPAGQISLVDYDGMFVPTLAGEVSPELGHPSYQHPGRTPEYYGLNLDNFASLVIYTSLLALADNPSLWQEFHNGENLLFTSEDFVTSSRSRVLSKLKASVNPEVGCLARAIEGACNSACSATPALSELLNGAKPRKDIKPTPDAPGCLVLLIDQSAAMSSPWGLSGRRGADLVSDAVNRAIQDMAAGSTISGRTRGLYDVAIIGYSSHARSAFTGRLNGRDLVSVARLSDAPLRTENRQRRVPMPDGSIQTRGTQFPIWLEPCCTGPASLTDACRVTYSIVERWVRTHQDCPPPIVLHVTSGCWPERTLPSEGEQLLRLRTKHGRAYVLHLLIGRSNAPATVFPESENAGFDAAARLLYQISSDVPHQVRTAFGVGDRSRGVLLHASYEQLVQLMRALAYL